MNAELNGNVPRVLYTEEDHQPQTIPLDDAFIALLADLRRDALAVEARAQGALMLYLRQHGLEGSWRIAENGRELVRATTTG